MVCMFSEFSFNLRDFLMHFNSISFYSNNSLYPHAVCIKSASEVTKILPV